MWPNWQAPSVKLNACMKCFLFYLTSNAMNYVRKDHKNFLIIFVTLVILTKNHVQYRVDVMLKRYYNLK
jgi:hypothetical protein